MKKFGLRFFLMTVSLILAVVLAELALRLVFPSSDLTRGGYTMNFAAGTLKSFVQDEEAGYLPKTNSEEYNEFGCLHNNYPKKKDPGKKRLLFIGDSVTHRARLINALRKLYGDAGYEYWNAGVESFNTFQEVVLYRRINAAIQPDQVILSFHNNDYMQTPMVFQKDGKLQMLTPSRDRDKINMWWFENSYFYRLLVGMSWRGDSQDKVQEVREALAELQKLTREQKVDLRVVLLPLMKPLKDWDEGELWSREESLKIFSDLQLPYYDLLPRLESLVAQGVAVEEKAGDAWHPNDAAASAFAEELKKQKLIQE